MDSKTMECLQACTKCYQECLKTINYCLEKGGEHASLEHIRLLTDCAEICRAATGFTIRESEFAGKLCNLCAEICEKCADSCDALADGDEQMKTCAAICRDCAKKCREMK